MHICNQCAATVRKAQRVWIRERKAVSVIITFLNGTKKEKSAEMIEKACGLAHAVNFPWAFLTIWGDSHSGTRRLPTYNAHTHSHTRTHTHTHTHTHIHPHRDRVSFLPGSTVVESLIQGKDDWQEVGEDDAEGGTEDDGRCCPVWGTVTLLLSFFFFPVDKTVYKVYKNFAEESGMTLWNKY